MSIEAELAEAQKLVKKLQGQLAQEQKDCIQALKDRDYYGSKWRLYEMECNRLGSPIAHNPLTKEQLEFLKGFL